MTVAFEDRIARLTIQIDLRKKTLVGRQCVQEQFVALLGHALEAMRYGRRRTELRISDASGQSERANVI